MALGDPYCSVAELREYTQINDNVDDLHLSTVCGAVSRQIELWCHRQFNDAGTVSARVYHPDARGYVYVDDFHTSTGLIVATDTGNDGVYETVVASTDYTLYPLGDGLTEPWRQIRLTGTGAWFPYGLRPAVQVTARWGWVAVPDGVKLAALMQGAKVFRRRFSPSGLQTVGSGDLAFTSWVSKIVDPDVMQLLEPYRLNTLLVA